MTRVWPRPGDKPWRRSAFIALSTAAALFAAGCSDGGNGKPRLVVSAASSLSEALTSCSAKFQAADVKLSLAGSDELAAQIRRGAKPDVFAAANTKLPEELESDGLLEKPVVFATNELVVAVPSGSNRVRSLDDLTRPGTKLAIGSASVPIGSYTRVLLSRLPPNQEDAILKNVRSEEPDVKGVVGKLTQKAVDAGLVYRSDVAATAGNLAAIGLPKALEPTISYGAGVVKGTKQERAARQFAQGLLSGPCATALRDARFGPPPR